MDIQENFVCKVIFIAAKICFNNIICLLAYLSGKYFFINYMSIKVFLSRMLYGTSNFHVNYQSLKWAFIILYCLSFM